MTQQEKYAEALKQFKEGTLSPEAMAMIAEETKIWMEGQGMPWPGGPQVLKG